VILITGAPDVLFRSVSSSRRMTDCSRSISLTGKGRLKSMPVRAAHGGCGLETARDGQRELDHPDLQDGVILLGLPE
jgi:hypothetical protein